MKVKLKKILKDILVKEIKGSKEIEITGLCSHSKLVAPGNLFVAKKGYLENGAQYIPEAIAAGAVAVLTDIYDPSFKHVTQVLHPDPAAIEALLAAHYYQNASHELFMVGITGTNGKTTTSFLVKHMLDQLGSPCGLIGSIDYIIGSHCYRATRTTPDVVTNHKMLREMVNQNCKSAVMEVTSHALDQGRVQYIDFDAAIFTNLTLDHLDYHKTLEAYSLAKQKLFKSLHHVEKKGIKFPTTAILNGDSSWCDKMKEGCRAKVLTYGIEQQTDLRATDLEFSSPSTHFKLHYQGKVFECSSPLAGRYNIYNYMAAISVGLMQGEPLDKLIHIMSSFLPVNGRLEKVPNSLGLQIYVDYAHTDDALKNVLETLQELKKGRIITVFGCGGDRDQTKRPKMAQVSEFFSDFTIVTSDNPRSENPEHISKQIINGFKSPESYLVVLDRREAIKKAIEMASPLDIVLIAGKGHETYQIFSHQTIEFDDRKVAAQICGILTSQCAASN